MSTLQPVLLSGGSGSRLWPLSREAYPKQFLALVGEDTMLQATWARIAELADPARGVHFRHLQPPSVVIFVVGVRDILARYGQSSLRSACPAAANVKKATGHNLAPV